MGVSSEQAYLRCRPLFRAVDDHREVDVSSPRLGFILKSSKTPDVMAALKAGGLQIFIQTGLDAGQSRDTCTDHCHPLNHAGEDVRLQAVRTLILWEQLGPF